MPSDTRSNGTAQHNEAPSAPAMLVRSAQPGDASDPEVSIDLAYAPYSGTESSTIRIPHDWSGLRERRAFPAAPLPLGDQRRTEPPPQIRRGHTSTPVT